jgi:hypothetical protein
LQFPSVPDYNNRLQTHESQEAGKTIVRCDLPIATDKKRRKERKEKREGQDLSREKRNEKKEEKARFHATRWTILEMFITYEDHTQFR